MDANFWHQKWQRNETAFHENKANSFLVKYFKELALPKGSRIFLPLCGKTLDIAWLLSQGYRVVGAELSELAISQLFEQLAIEPEVSEVGSLKHYRANNLDVLVGDIFEVTDSLLGEVDAIYDRAALVALPEAMRYQYTAHLLALTHRAPQLLICFEYDQSVIDGPPFSVSNEEVRKHYGEDYELSFMESIDVPGGLKGKCPAKEIVWLLK